MKTKCETFYTFDEINHMKALRLFLALTILFGLGSCQETVDGNGNIVQESRILSDFNEIRISGMYEVVLEEGDPGLHIETDENLIPLIKSEVEGGVLTISSEDKNFNSEKLILTISYDEIEELRCSGAVKLSTTSPISGDKFQLNISGAASGEFEVDVNKLKVDISGGAELTISGRANDASYEISGAGEVNAFQLLSSEVEIDLSGAGEVNVNAQDKLDIDVSGAADVNYIGSPSIKQSISGAGSVNQVNK